MHSMLRFFVKKQSLGIEITTSTVRLAAVSGKGVNRSVLFTKTMKLPDGLVNEDYSTQNIGDTDQLAHILQQEALSSASGSSVRRAALSLPDGVFRVQSLDFDEFPSKQVDREKLIRWRLEKSAFDISDTVLRYQVLRQQDKGFSALACLVKQAVLSQYEEVLVKAGFEPWSVGVASFHALNFYSSYLSKTSPVVALAQVFEDSFTTIISEVGGARFYRYKEMKQGTTGEIRARLMREIDDSLHFYTHMDRTQQSAVGRLYLTGDAVTCCELAKGFKEKTSLDVEVLSPSVIIPVVDGAGPEMAAALGAGCGL
jgi:Tfp pilus assembly PilM family ATPase